MKKLLPTICICFAFLQFNAQPRALSVTKSANKITSTGSEVTAEQAETALAYQNKARTEVGVAPLSWSPELAEYSQKWANNLVKNGECSLTKRPDSGEWKGSYGESTAKVWSQKDPILDASTKWYSEIKYFDNVVLEKTNWYAAPRYAQMVWKNSKSVGIGVAKCTNGYYIVVANYDPPGNILGQKTY